MPFGHRLILGNGTITYDYCFLRMTTNNGVVERVDPKVDGESNASTTNSGVVERVYQTLHVTFLERGHGRIYMRSNDSRGRC